MKDGAEWSVIIKLDKQIAEQLKMESKKNVKLSTIISSFNLKY